MYCGLTGGISATIAGGDFYQGMRHGLIVTGFNHLQHKFVNSFSQNNNGDDPPKNNPRDPKNNKAFEHLYTGQDSTIEASFGLAVTISATDGPFPVGEIVSIGVIGAAAIYDSSIRIHVTYTLINDIGQVYVGRTSGFDTPYNLVMKRYQNHHMRSKGFGRPMVDKAAIGKSGKLAIRGREQQVMDYYGGVNSKNVANSIRGVSAYNPLGKIYHSSSNMYFGKLYHYTGAFQ